MRHGDKINNLGRTNQHRKALLRNLSIALIEHKRINTTEAKAKALRRFIEPLVTKAKANTTHSRRVVFSYLQNKDAVKELFGPIAEATADRPGGYVRVIKLGFRRGDGADMAMIEFVDFNETYNPNAGKDRQSKKTRRGRKKAGSELTVAPADAASEEIAEEVVAEAEEAIEAAEETASEVTDQVEETVAEATEAVEEAAETAEQIAEETVMTPEATAEEAAPQEEASEEKKDQEEKKDGE
jgi:large subunit ribosomal protein L17